MKFQSKLLSSLSYNERPNQLLFHIYVVSVVVCSPFCSPVLANFSSSPHDICEKGKIYSNVIKENTCFPRITENHISLMKYSCNRIKHQRERECFIMYPNSETCFEQYMFGYVIKHLSSVSDDNSLKQVCNLGANRNESWQLFYPNIGRLGTSDFLYVS